jgi:hypothetical protein
MLACLKEAPVMALDGLRVEERGERLDDLKRPDSGLEYRPQFDGSLDKLEKGSTKSMDCFDERCLRVDDTDDGNDGG